MKTKTKEEQEFIVTRHNGPAPVETIGTRYIQIERKTFVFTLQDNSRGRLLRITEKAGGRSDAIVVPATGLAEFKNVIEELLELCQHENSATDPKP